LNCSKRATHSSSSEAASLWRGSHNEIILGKRGITADTALRLANHFGNSARYWMSLQADFDLEEARIPTTISRG